MDKIKWMIAGLLSIFLCGAILLGQVHPPLGQNMLRTLPVLTSAQKARIEKIGLLDQSAVADLNAGDYAEMEANAKKSIALGQDSGQAQELLATSLNTQGKAQEALKAYKVIADMGGDFPRDLLPYAQLLLQSGHWSKAVIVYNKALLSLPDVSRHLEIPTLHDGDLMRANSHFSPDVPQPRELAVAIHIAQGIADISDGGWGRHSRNDEAMGEFKQALQLAPDSALTNYYYGLGWFNLDLKSPLRSAYATQAKAAFQKATLGEPEVKRASLVVLKTFPS